MSKPLSGFAEYVLEQLHSFGGVTARAMFGGYGLYKQGVFFAAISDDRVFFRVSDRTRPRYEAAGMPPFTPGKAKPMRSYYEVPADVIESAPRMVEWAEEAWANAKAQRQKK